MSHASQRLSECAFAHGKVILGGEHAVVYGTPALAAGIPRALELRCAAAADQANALVLKVPAWDLERHLPREPQEDEDRLDQALRALFAAAKVSPWGHCITGHTELPAGAGLGSSAALSVGLAKLALGPDAASEDVFALSMVAESVFHGDPSGIDSHLSVNGGLVRFTKGQAPEPIACPKPIRLWIISSQTPRQSANLVALVKSRFAALPELAEPTWALFSAQVKAMQVALKSHDLKGLGLIMQMQHHLLSSLGVSTEKLDGLQRCALKAGALGAKLTGAGGGGCVLLLPSPDQSAQAFAQSLEAQMQSQLGRVFPHFPLEIQS